MIKARLPHWWHRLVCRLRGHKPVKHISAARPLSGDAAFGYRATAWRIVCTRCTRTLEEVG